MNHEERKEHEDELNNFVSFVVKFFFASLRLCVSKIFLSTFSEGELAYETR
jgi:hypothetical protein